MQILRSFWITILVTYYSLDHIHFIFLSVFSVSVLSHTLESWIGCSPYPRRFWLLFYCTSLTKYSIFDFVTFLLCINVTIKTAQITANPTIIAFHISNILSALLIIY